MMENGLLEEALKMPPSERVALAELILASIDHEEDGIRQAWIGEVRDRMKAVREGRQVEAVGFSGPVQMRVHIHEMAAREFDDAILRYDEQ